MAAPTLFYASATTGALCQGEIIQDLIVHELSGHNSTDGLKTFNQKVHPLAIVMTQSCDLEWDYLARQDQQADSPKLIPSILFCELAEAEELRADRSRVVNRDIWNRVKMNKEERFQFLRNVPPECDSKQIGIPFLVIDFKRYFTLPAGEVYQQITSGSAWRRAKLVSPFLEHLSSRFAYFLSRIGLPEEHAL